MCRYICVLVLVLVSSLSYAYVDAKDIEYILKNHFEKGFSYQGSISENLWVVNFDDITPVRIYIALSYNKDSSVLSMLNIYSTVLLLDRKPSSNLMEYLLRQNNYLEGWGFFYVYYDVNIDRWFVDYVVKIRQYDLSKESLIMSIRYVRLFVSSARKELKNFN